MECQYPDCCSEFGNLAQRKGSLSRTRTNERGEQAWHPDLLEISTSTGMADCKALDVSVDAADSKVAW